MPLISFSEYETTPDAKKVPVWLALEESRPLCVFAGIWTGWTCVRKAQEGEVNAGLLDQAIAYAGAHWRRRASGSGGRSRMAAG